MSTNSLDANNPVGDLRAEAECLDQRDPDAAAGEIPLAEGDALPADFDEFGAKRYGIRLDALSLLVKAGVRSEVVRKPVVSPLPRSPRWLLGLINLRGTLVPVFDLKGLCAPDDNPPPSLDMILVLDTGQRAMGIPIDALPVSLSKLTTVTDFPPVPGVLGHVETGELGDGGEVWIEFDHEACFTSLARKQ